jgi:hypothetical protein
MAEATQIKIATGMTSYGGDPESDERVSAREVRVEVTYQLRPGEDAAIAAASKAAEVERTRQAAWERIRAFPERTDEEDEGFDPAALGPEPPDESDGPGSPCYPEAFPEEADYVGRSNGFHRNGFAAPLSPAPVPEAVEWATKPQQMAIRSHYARLGLSPDNQSALLQARFGKSPFQRLTKAEAAQLMRELERGECLEQGGREKPAAASAASGR